MSRAEQFLLGTGRNREAVQVALVNNMPDAAMRATELQFARLLKEAAGPLDVRLRLFSLGTIARSGRQLIASSQERYSERLKVSIAVAACSANFRTLPE